MAKSQHYHALDSLTGRWTIASTILASSMAFIDGTALNVILPSLQQDLNANATDLFWVLNSYLLMLAALIIVGGSLGDKRGRVKIFKLGILLFLIGSLLCGVSVDITQLVVFRGLQGVGGAMMIPGSLSIINAVFDPDEKGKAIGTWSAATTIVTVGGPVLGGALADAGLWRFIFFINIPIGIVSLWILHFKVPESKEEGSNQVDWLGATLLASSLALMTFGFLQIPEYGIRHLLVLVPITVGSLLIVAFLWSQFRNDQAMVPLSLFRIRTFLGVNLLTFFLYAGLGGMMLFLSLNLIQIQGYSQLQAGLTFLPFSFTLVLFARYVGKLTDQFGAKWFLVAGPLLTAVGFTILAFMGKTGGPAAYWTDVFPGFIVFAIGMSITVVPLTTTVMGALPEEQSGIASGINNSMTRISFTFSNAVIGATAVLIFLSNVREKLSRLSLNQNQTLAVLEEAENFGEANTEGLGVSDALSQQVNHLYQLSFIETYQVVSLACAALALTSAIIAIVTIKR